MPDVFQINVRRHLEQMSHPEHPQQCSSTLLVEPAGGVKSCVRITHAILHCRFMSTIMPLLCRGTNQSQHNMKPFSIAESGIMNSINLDDYKNDESRCHIVKDLLMYERNMQQILLLFSSPQTIVNSKILQAFIATIIFKSVHHDLC
jgi:hypothetical protein